MSSGPDDQRLVLCAASRWERRVGSGYLVSPPTQHCIPGTYRAWPLSVVLSGPGVHAEPG